MGASLSREIYGGGGALFLWLFEKIINCETQKSSKRKADDKLSLVTSGELGSAVEMQWKYSGNAKCSVKTAR